MKEVKPVVGMWFTSKEEFDRSGWAAPCVITKIADDRVYYRWDTDARYQQGSTDTPLSIFMSCVHAGSWLTKVPKEETLKLFKRLYENSTTPVDACSGNGPTHR